MTIPLLGQCLIDKNQGGFHNDVLKSPSDCFDSVRALSSQHAFENFSQTSMAFSIVSDLDYFEEAMKVK